MDHRAGDRWVKAGDSSPTKGAKAGGKSPKKSAKESKKKTEKKETKKKDDKKDVVKKEEKKEIKKEDKKEIKRREEEEKKRRKEEKKEVKEASKKGRKDDGKKCDSSNSGGKVKPSDLRDHGDGDRGVGGVSPLLGAVQEVVGTQLGDRSRRQTRHRVAHEMGRLSPVLHPARPGAARVSWRLPPSDQGDQEGTSTPFCPSPLGAHVSLIVPGSPCDPRRGPVEARRDSPAASPRDTTCHCPASSPVFTPALSSPAPGPSHHDSAPTPTSSSGRAPPSTRGNNRAGPDTWTTAVPCSNSNSNKALASCPGGPQGPTATRTTSSSSPAVTSPQRTRPISSIIARPNAINATEDSKRKCKVKADHSACDVIESVGDNSAVAASTTKSAKVKVKRETQKSAVSQGTVDVRTKGRRSRSTGCLSCLSSKSHLGSAEDNRNEEESTSNTARHLVEKKQFATELRAQNYDVIRFATYRAACKLRFMQKRTNLYLVDIWNIIEAFRENGLNSLDHAVEVPVARLEALLATLFFQLNKRLPTSSQIEAEQSVALLHNFLTTAYDPEGRGLMRVFSIKVALSTMCSGKLMDKLRYIFTQISDSSGMLIRPKFEDYLREVLALPSAVCEAPSFGYNDTAARACFDTSKKLHVNDFLDTLMSDPGPQCMMWLPILHRMASVENVLHPVQCEGCHRESFMGFRYKCQRCYNYHLCQDCFWRGRVSGNHNNEHEVKEYSSYKSPAKELSHSLRKSFRCVPTKPNNRIPQFPEAPEKTLDLAHIVPPTPPPVHNGFPDTSATSFSRQSLDASSLDSNSATKSPSKLHGSIESTRMDEEHRLIARYASRLAADANNAQPAFKAAPVVSGPAHSRPLHSRSPSELSYSMDSNKAQRELIAQLETKNREIMNEIQRLREEQEKQIKTTAEVGQTRNPTLLAELRLLRQRRDELEARMAALQESRKELMVQLEGLMTLLKSHGSPRSTPNSSPRSRTGHSPPIPPAPQGRSGSAPSTPGDSLAGLGGDVRQAFTGQGPGSAGGASTMSSVRSLRNDLLVAADSVTNAMTSLVKELNSEASSGSEGDEDEGYDWGGSNPDKDKKGLSDLGDSSVDDFQAWREEMRLRLQQENDFLQELRARKQGHSKTHSRGSDTDHDQYMATDDGESYIRTDDESFLATDDADSYVKTDDEACMKTDEELDAELYDRDPKELLPHRYTTDEESCLETDQESYIRTDDEDGGNTDWEDARRRWVNR